MKARSFAQKLLPSFSIGEGSTHVAAMTYSDTARSVFGFNDIKSKNASIVKSRLMSIPYSGGKSSRVDKALEFAQSMLQSSGRANVNQVNQVEKPY